MNGKGSKPRPVDEQKFNQNFEKIFGSKPLASLNKKKTEDESKRVKKASKKL
jgi:hypothetical protein